MVDGRRRRLEVIQLTGHTPGSVALLYDDPDGTPHLFTGDCLFPGGPGRTTIPAASTSLMADLEEKVFDRLRRRDLGLPRPRRGLDPRAERPAARAVARAGLVAGATG